jgi:hypothetical protein
MDENFFIPTIVEKMRICMYFIKKNISIDNFNSIQELINRISNNDLLRVFGHNSYYSFNELCSAIFNSYKKFIMNELSFSQYFSLIVDDSENAQRKNQVCIFVKYLNSKMNIKTDFLSIKNIGIEGATSQNLFSIICEVMKEFNFEEKNIVSLCTDDTSNMRGEISGLASLSRDCVLDIIYYYCASHRLNLVIQQSLQKFSPIMEYLNDAEDIVCYMNGSPNRVIHLEFIQKQLKKPCNQILQPSGIR